MFCGLWMGDGDGLGECGAIDRRRNGSSPTHSPNSHTLLVLGREGRERERVERESEEGGGLRGGRRERGCGCVCVCV